MHTPGYDATLSLKLLQKTIHKQVWKLNAYKVWLFNAKILKKMIDNNTADRA